MWNKQTMIEKIKKIMEFHGVSEYEGTALKSTWDGSYILVDTNCDDTDNPMLDTELADILDITPSEDLYEKFLIKYSIGEIGIFEK